MEEENSKQAEARRLLDAIRLKQEEKEPEKKPVVQKATNWSVTEDAAQLQALVEQKRGIKPQPAEELPPEPLPEPENIDPISVEQIKVMRKAKAAIDATPALKTEHMTQRIYESIIRSYFEVRDYFNPSSRLKRCLKDGHQCLHCGEKFLVPPAPKKEEPTN